MPLRAFEQGRIATAPDLGGKKRPSQKPGEVAGFVRMHGGKGSHRKFRHLKFPGFVLISGHDGHDAQPYQEEQVRNALRYIQS